MMWLLETLRMNADVPINFDELDVSKDSVALRLVPTNTAARLMLGKNENRQIQILVKSKDQKAAMMMIETLTELYEDLQEKPHLTYNGKYRIISANVYTDPNFVSKIENKFYVYTAILQFEMERMN